MALPRMRGHDKEAVPEGTRISIAFPDDFHHHFRNGVHTTLIASHAARRFRRCIAMPNLRPPVINAPMAMEYREHILNSLPGDMKSNFEPLMTLYLTDRTKPEDIEEALETGHIYACKYFPAGATTNSDFGVTNVRNVYPVLEKLAEVGMMLCIHSEVATPFVDIFEREATFIEEVMKPLVRDIPNLKIVMEHISTAEAVNYVLSAPDNVGASITCHHLLFNRNAMLVGGIKPHFYCLPILKHERHRLALLDAATSGNPKFFAGTDSAPHATHTKETFCGCAGSYTAHAAVELYAEAFESVGKLDKLEAFCSQHGADWYGLERTTDRTLTLEKKSWVVPEQYDYGAGQTLTPLCAGETISWSIV